MKAQIVPWSSVVGTGIMLLDDSGKCIATLGLRNVGGNVHDLKYKSLEIVEKLTEIINNATSKHPTNN